jgi:hypothetical protein
MALGSETLIELRDRIAAMYASPCGMAHESIPSGPDGKPLRSAHSPSGFGRTGICPAPLRAKHLGCSHTMARYLLRDALLRLPGGEGLLGELHELEQAISLLDHRRYDAESRLAAAIQAQEAGATAAAERDIAALVMEHRGYVARAARLREDVLHRIDDALADDGTKPEGCRA